jgi:hypothetical protein
MIYLIGSLRNEKEANKEIREYDRARNPVDDSEGSV